MTIKSMADLESALAVDDINIIQDNLPPVHTHSSLSMFQTCEQKWTLRYVLGLSNRRTSKYFVVGTLMHKGIELLLKWTAAPNVDDLGTVRPSLSELLASFDFLYEKMVDEIATKSDMIGPNDAETLEYCRCQALAMTHAWAEYVLPRLNETYEVIGSEMLINLPNGGSPAVDGEVSGKIDGVVKHRKTGHLMVIEHKSTSRLGSVDTSRLALDQQANWYMTAYTMMTGLPVKGFVYDVIQKPAHKMSSKGSDDLINRMRDAMLADPEKYFGYFDVIADQRHRRNSVWNMTQVKHRAMMATPSTITRNTAQCAPFAGSPCPYKQLCQDGFTADNLPGLLKIDALHQYDVMPPNTELEVDTSDE